MDFRFVNQNYLELWIVNIKKDDEKPFKALTHSPPGLGFYFCFRARLEELLTHLKIAEISFHRFGKFIVFFGIGFFELFQYPGKLFREILRDLF